MTNHRRFALPGVIAALAAAVLITAPGWVAALDVKVFAIGDFVSSGSGGCGGGDRSHWPSMVDHWYDEMGSKGHTKDGQYTNGSMTIRRFCDPDWYSACRDYLYADDADAFMIATHGSDSGDHWAGTMRYEWNGNCKLDAGGTSDDMWVGSVNTEFIHLSSCYSADDDNISGIRYMMFDPVDTPVNGRRAHQVTGFHGIMWIGSGYDDDYEDFADDAHSTAISRSWVNNLYDSTVDCEWYDPFNWFGTCDEQCPVAYAISSSGSAALTRLNYERYNFVYSDPPGHSGYAWRFIVSCDPDGESSFSTP